MGRKFKYSVEDKIQAVKDYLSGRKTTKQICSELGIRYNSNHGNIIRVWAKKYKLFGESSLHDKPHNKSYSSNLKTEAVEAYISGEGSKEEICFKYGILSTSILTRWVKKYNSNIELKDYEPKWEVYMAKSRRKTSKEERLEIVKYCIDNERNYKLTAEKYDVSYSQVYSWVKKYDDNGETALIDRRGHHKTDEEVDEIERLSRENKRLKRQLEEKDMVVELLKKVQEIERRRY
ncbi:MAG: helix-turn-helix domain-containing protein [Clostridium sp.]|jgi:transposase-like protein|nr:transposase [Romboutsia sp.]MCR4944510.1 helix-turn-helix domain-containing protein [Clostridium sp.]